MTLSMKKGFKNITTSYQVLVALSLYLFLTLANLFFLPCLTSLGQSHNQITVAHSYKDGGTKSNLVRSDKAVLKKNSIDIHNDSQPFNLTNHSSEKNSTNLQVVWIYNHEPVCDRRYSYLLLLILRI
jgi:hypothetical protein